MKEVSEPQAQYTDLVQEPLNRVSVSAGTGNLGKAPVGKMHVLEEPSR